MALFKAQPETTLSVKGMHCPKCVARVTNALEEIEGVTKVAVSLEEENAVVTGQVDGQVLVDAVNELGFTAALA